MQPSTDAIIDYYHTKESRWGYKLVLGGTKHFGYYPAGQKHVSMRQAMLNMVDKLGEALDLPKGSRVLDAGCGEGATALRLAEKFKLHVDGVDLLDFNIAAAQQRATANNLDKQASFQVGSYLTLDYPDESFDAVYTMETLVHAPDYKVALAEFRRVLKPKGRLVLFEYSMPTQNSMGEQERKAFQIINDGSAMYSYPLFIHGSFPKLLTNAGFKDVQVEDITEQMMPMLRRFWQMGVIPYQLIKLLGKQKQFVNATAGVELYKYREDFRYNIVTAIKA